MLGFSLNVTGDPVVTTVPAKFTRIHLVVGSGIAKLDGDYYIRITATECVWVRTDGSFAIIFKKCGS